MGILVGYLLGILTASKHKDQHASPNADSSNTPQRQPPSDWPLSVVCIPPPKSEEEYAEENKKKRRETIKFRVELIGAFVLIIYTFFTILMWHANKKSADAAKSAADTAAKQLELTSRPWVDIDVSITSPVTYDSNGMHVSFTFAPKNIGQSPAQDVSIAPKLVPGSMGTDVREMQKRICDNRAAASDEPLRYVLFPDRSYKQEITMGITDTEINSQWSKFELRQKPNDLIPVLIIGCVDYTYDSSPRHHQTGFAFDILMKDRRILLKSKMPLQPDSVGLMEHSFGGHFAN
jgi:hypothetical protein